MRSSRLKKALDAIIAKKKATPVVLPAQQGINAAASSLGQALGGIPAANPNVGTPQQGTREHPETARFRSFAERYMIARAHNFRPEHEKEDQWTCILNAKAAYAMIARVGANINPQIGDDTF